MKPFPLALLAGLGALVLMWASTPSLPGAQAQSATTLANGGFETGLDGWYFPPWYSQVVQPDTTHAHSGSSALRFQGRATSPYLQQDVPASPGSIAQFEGYAQIPKAVAGMQLLVEVIVRGPSNADLQTLLLSSVSDTGGNWVQLRGSAVMPQRTVAARLRIRVPTLNGIIYIDDLMLQVAQPQTPTATPQLPTMTSPPTTTARATPTLPQYTATTVAVTPTLTASATGTPIPDLDPLQPLANGDFEDGLNGWYCPSWFSQIVQVDRSYRYSGSASLRFQGRASYPYVQQDVSAPPGSIVRFIGYVMIPERRPGVQVDVELIARTQYNGDIQSFQLASVGDTGGGWIEVRGSAVMPQRTATVRLRVRIPALNGTVYVDGLALQLDRSHIPTTTPTRTPAETATTTPTITATPTITPTPGPTRQPRIDLDPSLRIAQVGDIIGAVINEDYWAPNDPVYPERATQYLGRTISRIRELAPANGRKFAVRLGHVPTDGYEGGDGYHWQSAFGPQPPYAPIGASTTIDAFMDYASRIDGEPYLFVNFGSGTAAEAAAFVSYANGTDPSNPYVALRVANGHPEPYNVVNWMIGGEQYGSWSTGFRDWRSYDYANPTAKNGGDPQWHRKPASDPANFAARAAEYAQRMREASPTTLRLWAPLNFWDLRYWGGVTASAPVIVGRLGPYVDGFVLHYYPAAEGPGETDQDLLGSTGVLAGNLDRVRALLDQYGPQGKQLQIGDLEFNNRSGSNEQTHQLVNGLFVADTLRVLATRGIASAHYFAISVAEGHPSGYSYFEQGDVDRPMPSYLATQLVAGHLGNYVVQSSVSGGSVIHAPGGSDGPFSYPSLTVLASLSLDLKTLYLVAINKDLSLDQRMDLHLGPVSAAPTSRVTTLTAPSAQSIAGEVQLTETEVSTDSLPSWTFPAHSITAFRIPIANTPSGEAAPD